MPPLVSALLVLLAVCTLGVTAGLFGATIRASISRKSKEITEDREKMRKLSIDTSYGKSSLMDMSAEQRLDIQRELITNRADTHPVEFIATLMPERAGKGSAYTHRMNTDSHRMSFVRSLEFWLKSFFPLGGHFEILPYRRSDATGVCTLHVIVYMETATAVDAHEVAQHVCGSIMGDDKFRVTEHRTYQQVTFFPVKRPHKTGNAPGLWSREYTSTDDTRKYLVVERRTAAIKDLTGSEHVSAQGDWVYSRDELIRVTDEFAEFEFSPLDVTVSRRLLWDLTEPATARFYEAFNAANVLLTDSEPTDIVKRQEFIDAVQETVQAWTVADRNARDKAEQNIVSGNKVLDTDQIRHKDTAQAALALAIDPSSTESEAGIAWMRSMESLSRAGLTVPPSKVKKLESNKMVARAMKALPAGN